MLAFAPEEGGVDFDVGSRWQAFRRFVRERIVQHKLFDNIVLVFILANCVFLALDSPLDDPESAKQKALATADNV